MGRVGVTTDHAARNRSLDKRIEQRLSYGQPLAGCADRGTDWGEVFHASERDARPIGFQPIITAFPNPRCRITTQACDPAAYFLK